MKRKRVYRCYSCGKHYTNETGRTNPDGTFAIGLGQSTRPIIVGTNLVHSCKALDNIAPTSNPTPNPTAIETANDVTHGTLNPVANPNPMPQVTHTVSASDVLNEHIAEDAKSKLDAAGQAIYQLIEPAIDARIDALAEQLSNTTKTVTHKIEMLTGSGNVTVIDNAHRQTEFLLRLSAIRVGMDSQHLNVMLVGPAGTGKTTVARIAAKELGREFFAISVGPQSTKSDFFGYTDAMGRPVWTVIRDAFVNGGVLLIDEMDSATSGALTYLNSILANSVAYFPASSDSTEKTVKAIKHNDFFVIAGANTFGKGHNPLYNSRVALDGATLDRFVGILWDYDTDMERRLFSAHFSNSAVLPHQTVIDTTAHVGSSLPWGDFIWLLRRAVKDLGLNLIYGMRKLENGAAMLDSGLFSRAEVEATTAFFGVSDDERSQLLAKLADYALTGVN